MKVVIMIVIFLVLVLLVVGVVVNQIGCDVDDVEIMQNMQSMDYMEDQVFNVQIGEECQNVRDVFNEFEKVL